MLKEVKTTKDGIKCSKCNRDIKKSWAIFYDSETKTIYCKPCGSNQMQKDSSTQDGSASDGQFDILFDMLGKHNELISVLNESIDELVSLHKPEKKPEKKTKAKSK